jgi:hypothetical protein
MTTRRPALSDLPFWPRYLSREQAAVYVGVSADTFDQEVVAGLWPGPRRRGGKGGRLTWDRCMLDAAADRDSGLGDGDPFNATQPAVPALTGVWRERGSDGATSGKRSERRSQTSA